jgi:hypothetical protein
VEENELRRSQLSPISQISMSRSTFYMIYIVVISFWRFFIWFTYLELVYFGFWFSGSNVSDRIDWLHDRHIFNCFIAAFCSLCRMGGTVLTFNMICIFAIRQLVNCTFVHDLHSFNWFFGISHIIYISLYWFILNFRSLSRIWPTWPTFYMIYFFVIGLLPFSIPFTFL